MTKTWNPTILVFLWCHSRFYAFILLRVGRAIHHFFMNLGPQVESGFHNTPFGAWINMKHLNLLTFDDSAPTMTTVEG